MNRSYPYKHWLTTLVIAPFIPAIFSLFFKMDDGLVFSLLEVYPISFLFSLFFSLPTVAVYYLVFYLLSKRIINLTFVKILLIGIAVIGITITQLIIKGSLSFTIIYAYSIAAIISGLFWKLRTVNYPKEEFKIKSSI